MWTIRGEIALEENDESAAASALERAIAVSPNQPDPRWYLSEAYERRGEPELAEEVLRSAIARAPGNAVSHGYLADLQYRQEKVEESIESIGRAISLDPAYSWAWQCLKDWTTAVGRPGAVEERARELTRSRGGEASSWVRLARVIEGRGRTEERLRAADRAIALAPWRIEAHELCADILAAAGRFELAEAACRPAVFGDRLPIELRVRAIALIAEEGRPRRAIEMMAELLEEEETCGHGWS